MEVAEGRGRGRGAGAPDDAAEPAGPRRENRSNIKYIIDTYIYIYIYIYM